MHGLNRLLSKPSNLLVLRCLYYADEPLSGREVERRTGLSNRATMLALDQLCTMAATQVEETPSSNWYSINANHYLIAKGLKHVFEAEENFWDDLRRVVRRVVHPRPIAAVATGPLARDESLSTGTVNLIMLFSTNRHSLRAFRCMDQLGDALWDRHAVNLEYELLDVRNMDNEENTALWKRVEREGILLFGSLP